MIIWILPGGFIGLLMLVTIIWGNVSAESYGERWREKQDRARAKAKAKQAKWARRHPIEAAAARLFEEQRIYDLPENVRKRAALAYTTKYMDSISAAIAARKAAAVTPAEKRAAEEDERKHEASRERCLARPWGPPSPNQQPCNEMPMGPLSWHERYPHA